MEEPSEENGVDCLCIVACHAIWLGGISNGHDESEWLIEPFQTGETPTFIEHIKAGLNELATNPRSILVFSGGDTKQDRTKLSEAESYRNLALANDLFGHSTSLSHRIVVENLATDSFQNVLLPLLMFPTFVAKISNCDVASHVNSARVSPLLFPKHLTIVGHEFKRRRFEELHLPAVKWPVTISTFKYVGIDPPMDEGRREEIIGGDLKRGFGAWVKDLYGTGEVLRNKGKARGWSEEKQMFVETVVRAGWTDRKLQNEILRMLEWMSRTTGTEVYPGPLPWARSPY